MFKIRKLYPSPPPPIIIDMLKFEFAAKHNRSKPVSQYFHRVLNSSSVHFVDITNTPRNHNIFFWENQSTVSMDCCFDKHKYIN